mmetsp:Transcript_23715/g.51547  ORF Transcript_23715/g.51547 Transcript_23715/m.51547 type:complete len:94 (+) Transcript_23715:182-463(+)
MLGTSKLYMDDSLHLPLLSCLSSCANQSGGECFDTLVSCITTACRENADDCKAYVSTVHKACNEKCGMDFWCPLQCFAKFQQDRKNCENMKPL